MGKYTDMAWRLRQQPLPENRVDGHDVVEVLLETDRMIIFRDSDGRLWRRVHAWGMTWPVTIKVW